MGSTVSTGLGAAASPHELRLLEATLDLADDYRELIEETLAEGEESYPRLFAFLGLSLDDVRSAIVALRQLEGATTAPHMVPSTTYWLVQGERIVAEGRVRHRLNEHLLHEGGHIGYLVRPSQRRRGHGRRMLSLLLPRCRDVGIERVLVTCDRDNVASARIIVANGGVLENEVTSHHTGKVVQRYWIDLDGVAVPNEVR